VLKKINESVCRFFLARQVSEIILNEYSRTTKNALFKWLGKRQQGILQNQSIRGFFGLESGFQNWFWNFSNTSGLSYIGKI
jgi:hypothetical protein